MELPSLVCLISLICSSSAQIKRVKSFGLPRVSDTDYHHCPKALEIENEKPNEFLDLEYLDGLCKNVVGVIRMRVSGNFNGIAEALFNKLPRLEEFEGNDMENLTEVTAATWNLKYLDLSRNNLEKVTFEFMDEIMYLNLSRNKLSDEYIVMSSMRPSLSLKLRTLDLSHNKLSKIDLLYPFWNLKKFILNDNQIVYIRPGILQKYPNLVSLNLARNKLYQLANGMFIGLIYLVNLDLSHNQLTDARVGIINSLRSLEFLDMEGNNIKHFDYNDLDHHLEVLRINDQHTYIHGKKILVPLKKTQEANVTTTEKSTTVLVTRSQ